MEKIITTNDFINPIGKGYEGIVYNYDNKNVVKVIGNCTLNKVNKIELLNKLEIDRFIFPDKLVTLENGKPIGYTMKKVETNEFHNLDNILNSNITLDKKIKYLKDLENQLKVAHQNGITLVDLNFTNFLIDQNDDVVAIDTDNFTYKELKTDSFPTLYSFLYRNKVSKTIDENMDKFSFTMKILEYLCYESILQFDLVNYHPYRKDLENFVKNLDIPLNIKTLILHNISNDPNKVYFNNVLDKLSSSKQYLYKK
jgi:serine/threonine protein kinase